MFKMFVEVGYVKTFLPCGLLEVIYIDPFPDEFNVFELFANRFLSFMICRSYNCFHD